MQQPGRRRPRLVRLGRTVAWLFAAALISLAGAGLVVSADHLPGDATRPERTWAQDVAFQARIRALAPEYASLSAQVGALGDTARNALVDLAARRTDLLESDLAKGDALVTETGAQTARLSGMLDVVGSSVPEDQLGDRSRAMLSAARAALATTEPLAGDWRTLADESLPAIQLVDVLDRHDQLVFAAVQQAHASNFAGALKTLAEAKAQLDQARQTRDALQGRADVSTLTTYIDRMSSYDQALTALYANLQKTGGRMTPAGEKLVAKVSAAQKLLPPDTRAIVVIMGDVAQAGLNQAAIAIEQARGDLATAVAALHFGS